MAPEHRRPLAAFAFVVLTTALVLGNGLRTQVVSHLVHGRAPAVLVSALAPDLVLGRTLHHAEAPTTVKAVRSSPHGQPSVTSAAAQGEVAAPARGSRHTAGSAPVRATGHHSGASRTRGHSGAKASGGSGHREHAKVGDHRRAAHPRAVASHHQKASSAAAPRAAAAHHGSAKRHARPHRKHHARHHARHHHRHHHRHHRHHRR